MTIATEAAHAVADHYQLDGWEWDRHYRLVLGWIEELARVGYTIVRMDPDAEPYELAKANRS